MNKDKDSRTLITLADLKNFVAEMDRTKPYMGNSPGEATRFLMVYLIQYIEKEAAKQK